MELRIALAQIPVTQDIGANRETLRRAVDFAAGEGAQILLTPEGALSGYWPGFDRREQEQAQKELEAFARSRKVGLALGTCREEGDGLCYNELRFYSPEGEFLGFHAKTLLCGTPREPVEGEIHDYHTRPLQVFSFRGLCVGGLICNDLWANPEYTPMPDPHLAVRLREMGARVIFHAVNGGGDGTEYMRTTIRDYHTSNVTMRARAAGIPIVTVDALGLPGVPVASPGGVVDQEGRRVFSLPDTGEQLGAFTLTLPELSQ